MLDYPLYSPVLAPCDFYLFPRSNLHKKKKKTRFETVKAVKEKLTRVMNELTEDFQHRFILKGIIINNV